MEEKIVKFNGQIEESRLDQLKTSLNNLGVQFTVQKQLTFEDLGLAEVKTANAIPPPQQQQQTQQKVQIVRSSDGKIQVRGLLPGQQLVQLPDGKLKIFLQTTIVQQQLQPVQQQQPQVQQQPLVHQQQPVTLQTPIQNQLRQSIIVHPSGSTSINTMATPFSVLQNSPKILPNTTNCPQGQGSPQQPKIIVATPLQPGQPITPGTTVFMSGGKTYCIPKASMLAQQHQQVSLEIQTIDGGAVMAEVETGFL